MSEHSLQLWDPVPFSATNCRTGYISAFRSQHTPTHHLPQLKIWLKRGAAFHKISMQEITSTLQIMQVYYFNMTIINTNQRTVIETVIFTLSLLDTTDPSGRKAGAGNVNQSTSSQKSFVQSADQTLTRLSALVASQRYGADTGESTSYNTTSQFSN